MKILHFITAIDKSGGGTTAYMQLISKELKDLVDLIVVTGSSAQPIELPGVDVRFLNLSVYRWYVIQAELRELLKIEKPDVVHINGIWQPQCWLFQRIAQQLGIIVIMSPHGMLEPYILNRHPWKKKLALALYQHKALSRVDYYHATAQSELEQIRKLGFLQPTKIIPNGIEIKEIYSKTAWNDVQNILFLSRIHPKKGIELLIEAVAKLKNKQLQIIIAGDGEIAYLEELKRLAKDYHVSQQLNFKGGVYGDSKWELFQQADLFVLPSYSENFGIVVAEALATGLPVITTTGTPWRELETNRCGWCIELCVDNLVKTLNEAVATDASELRLMGERGRKLVEEKYDINAVTKSMNNFYMAVYRK